MSDAKVDPIWDTTEPFAEQTRPEPKLSKKKKPGTEAEIALPADETFEPVLDELGDVIDGGEDDISAFEEQDPTVPIEVAVDLDGRARAAETISAAAPKRSEPMSENKKTKAELIRDEIDKRRAKSDDPIRPRDIIAALESRGIKVAAPQVSVALRDFDKPKTDKAAKTSKASTPEATTKTEQTPKRAAAKVRSAVLPKSASAANEPSYAALESAASFVKGSGGLETARQLLDAYARLFNPAG
jgi:hypothetical protein